MPFTTPTQVTSHGKSPPLQDAVSSKTQMAGVPVLSEVYGKIKPEGTAVKEYKCEGKTFQLDDSKGCYVAVTYEHLTGHVGVNLGDRGTDEHPYTWHTERALANPASDCVTPDGLKFGIITGASFKTNLDALCAQLLLDFRSQEARKAFDPAKYCAELHDAVKNLP